MSYHSKKSFAQRFSGLIIVAVLHIVVIVGLIYGLRPNDGAVQVEDVKVKKVEEEKVVEELPPPPPPDYTPPPPPPPSADMVTVAADAPVVATNAITTAKTTEVVAPAVKTNARPGPKTYTKPEYPSASKTLGEEGVVGLEMLIGVNGKVEDSKVIKSSGFPRLDEAVLKESKKWKGFTPCMDGPTPVACTLALNMRMQVKDAK